MRPASLYVKLWLPSESVLPTLSVEVFYGILRELTVLRPQMQKLGCHEITERGDEYST
jgi:hypothetical protein